MNERKTVPFPKNSLSLRFLYHTAPGRGVLKLLCAPALSRVAGRFLDSEKSQFLVNSFLEKNHIDLTEYEAVSYDTFNACFSRKIRPEHRPIDREPTHLISPCDALLSLYPIEDGLVLPIKQSSYSVERLLQNRQLAREFEGGTCLVFRLCVHHYHRYSFVDDGTAQSPVFIPGKLHTVRPIALEQYPVFVENSRAYTVIDTANFGKVVQMEVGALLVGKIQNHSKVGTVCRGEEKGTFLYGGSTIVLLLPKGAAEFPKWMWEATENCREIPVKLGEALGTAGKAEE